MVLLCALCSVGMAATGWHPSVIPQPQSVEWGNGAWTPGKKLAVSIGDSSLLPAARLVCDMLAHTGTQTTIVDSHAGAKPKRVGKKQAVSGSADIVLSLHGGGVGGSYTLDIAPGGVVVSGADYEGVVNGISTLRQLLPMQAEGDTASGDVSLAVPCVKVADSPRYSWRGLMVDCSRHFFSADEMRRVLDLMSLYKLNRLHWHLTDDQGWRVEIKHYPLLTSQGGWRTFNGQDRWCMQTAQATADADLMPDPSKMHVEARDTVYGGFYTQQDIRDVVAYAAERGIDVVPEVDMPGHSLSAVMCYPWLGCGDSRRWDGFSSPLCLGNDSVLAFCRDVWGELMALFPSRYVHIGGDEVAMSFWNGCAKCRSRMAALGLADGHALQAWFTRGMEHYFALHGRRMIGWDEILAGGVSREATVMWWRGGNADAAVAAAEGGNDVVCCPTTHFYFDYTENEGDIEKIYRFALPRGMSQEAQAHVLGIQANIWTEHVPSFNRLMHMVFPRMLAEAETAWTDDAHKSWPSFAARLSDHYARLERLGVKYRMPGIAGLYDRNLFVGSGEVRVACADTSAVIRYTTDGSVPDEGAAVYNGPLTVDSCCTMCFRAFGHGGKKGEPRLASFAPAVFSDAVDVSASHRGVVALWYKYAGATCSGITSAPFAARYVVDRVCIPDSVRGDIGLVVKGYVKVPADGLYGFVLSSDDGSTLTIDGQVAVDNDGEHATVIKSAQVALRKGYHAIEVRYFDHNGGNLDLDVYDAAGHRLSAHDLFFWSDGM